MVDITGKKDAMAIKEEYQNALNYAHEDVKKKVSWLFMMNHKLKDNLAAIQKLKKDIIADEDEKHALYTNLFNLLKDEKNFEKEMLVTSKKATNKTKVIIKPKFKDTDIDDVKINAMQEYLDKYPEYATKSSFKKILDKIEDVEKGIKDTKKKYNFHISEVLKELSYWPRNIMEAENKIKRFKEQLKEGQERLKNMRYHKGIFYKLADEKEKMKVNIHTLYYRIEEFEDTVKKLKEEAEKAKKQDLETMDY
ncbi:MAG TPA: LemA family protein [archaeon]|nr:LemA family protein [archaeon]